MPHKSKTVVKKAYTMETISRYVTQREGNWYVGESRVELYSIVASWQQGYSPEETWNGLPHLALRDIYGAILYYLEHQDEMDTFFRSVDGDAARLKAEAEAARPEFYAALRERMAAYRASATN